MKLSLKESVVEFLAFSRTSGGPTRELSGFSAGEWEHSLTWMDYSGLALYFLRAIQSHTDWVPRFVLECLQNKLGANLERTAYMERQFAFINRAFEEAGVRYAAVKGFTLVPEFCPEASLRHQSDLDYLVNGPSLDLACQVLEDIGYVLHKEAQHEVTLILPHKEALIRIDEQYNANTPHSVELHLTVGELRHLAWEEPQFLENAVKRAFQGSAFCSLPDDDTFVLQSIHAFYHILDGWIKLSWLYEIGYFLEKRATDSDLWQRISTRLSDEPPLREAVAVVVSLAAQFFRARIPFTVNRWVEEIRPTVRMWIEKYSRPWVFGHNLLEDEYAWFPTRKLVLFLYGQYVPDSGNWRSVLSRRLLALRGIDKAMRRITRDSSAQRWQTSQLNAREFWKIPYHIGANLRYLWELPRWWLLTRPSSLTGSNYIPPRGSPNFEQK